MANLRATSASVFALLGMCASSARSQPVQFPDNGHWYEVIVVSDLGWEVARHTANLRGGYLATVTSPDENAFVHSLVVSTPGSWFFFDGRRSIGPWLGGWQPDGSQEPDGGWVWITGEPFSYTNWAPGQPDDDDRGECYLHFSNLGMPLDGTWNDRGVNDRRPDPGYVVEYDELLCPDIIEQPFAQNRCEGEDARFVVHAFSPWTLSYQWRKDGENLGNIPGKIEGVTTNALFLSDLGRDDAGLYDCVVTNLCGSIATDAVRLRVGAIADLTGSSDPTDPAYGVPDGVVNNDDYLYFLDQFAARNPGVADLTGSGDPESDLYGVPNGVIDADDFFYYLDAFTYGCPASARRPNLPQILRSLGQPKWPFGKQRLRR
ncbi:MAG: hypothetical protein H6811_01070 [Phycisphaeraceae bacterium]|nr:hypothetical protein [Phycisphaeraceae bacterium]